jgi:LysR family hydrogen peroxide-inducible transcriptional activator
LDLSLLTLQQFRYIVAVGRHGSFREAATACHVSQPALSTQVKKVEETLGLVLFDRTRQPIVATEIGTRIVAHAQHLIEQVDQLEGLVRGTTELVGSYRLGIIPSLVSSVVPLLLPRFLRARPGIELEVVETKTEDLVRRLREGSLDGGVAAVPLEIARLNERVLFHEELFVYVAPGHPLADRERVRQADLVDEEVWLLREGHCFRSQVLHLCSADGRRPKSRVQFDADSFETLLRLVDAGVGITIVPELLARALPASRRERQLRRFAAPIPYREVGLLLARDALKRETSDALVETLQAALPPELRGRRRRPTLVLRP